MSCGWADPAPGSAALRVCENGAKRSPPRPRASGCVPRSSGSTPSRSWPGTTSTGSGPGPPERSRCSKTSTPSTMRRSAGMRPSRSSPSSSRPWTARSGHVLHVRPRAMRPPSSKALRPGLRHQQPARLFQHVPRILRHGITETIGIGKGSSRWKSSSGLARVRGGPEPRHHHPRMLTALEKVKRAGRHHRGRQPAAGSGSHPVPQPQKVRGVLGSSGTALADHHLQIRLGGDQALSAASARSLLGRNAPGSVSPGLSTVFDTNFIAAHTTGFDDWLALLRARRGPTSRRPPGSPRNDPGDRQASAVLGPHRRLLGHGPHSAPALVQTIQEVVKRHPGPGATSVARAPACFRSVATPTSGDRHHGHLRTHASGSTTPWTRGSRSRVPAVTATTWSTPSAACGTVASGSSSAWAGTSSRRRRTAPVTEAALAACDLTVTVSTKLNHSHFSRASEL